MSKKLNSVVTYSRVTAQEQTKGYSLESQREQLKEYAEKNNLEIVREFSDIGSSVRGKRQPNPIFKAVIKNSLSNKKLPKLS